ncbi:Tubulin binding cofactor A [Carpediemonas membranifera]|uniref:Tubulin-specific chaperone A n=1 Tax=Carpediemonas membranifera TaxID=201153 RepID=A0A8J6ATZ3_9EUKA|nr:Tubulin binding cofactor A [Carpediemonas membranifera]|eukprot:KAG9392375.1 Tubulin binding cofactor A [Carpediemonas membranifera]
MEKQLKIKLGVVKRTTKDVYSYHKEVEEETAKLPSFTDEFKIKQQKESIAESKLMVRDSKKRLGTALAELKAMVSDNIAVETSEDGAEVKKAIKEAEEAIAME